MCILSGFCVCVLICVCVCFMHAVHVCIDTRVGTHLYKWTYNSMKVRG